jgi:hypothetical protein
MVILRVVRETLNLLFAEYRGPFPVDFGKPIGYIAALLVMPLDIGTGGLASRPRFFGTGGFACWSGIGFSRTGDLADRFGLSLDFPNFTLLE